MASRSNYINLNEYLVFETDNMIMKNLTPENALVVDFMVVIQFCNVDHIKVQTYTRFVRSYLDTVAVRNAMKLFRSEYPQDQFVVISVHVVPSVDSKLISEIEHDIERLAKNFNSPITSSVSL